jgi:hypothetical protein
VIRPALIPRPWLACVALGLLLLALPAAHAATPRTWVEGPASLARGSADGVAVSRRGILSLAPEISRLGEESPPGRPQQVWAMTADRSGNIFLGTGPDGRILKITPAGAQTLLYTVDEPLVTALAIGPDGDLLAGTAPRGRIYRIRADGSGEVWVETGERYVWSLAPAGGGAVWAGTGERGRVLRISGSGSAEPFFDSDEPHVVSLLPLEDGTLLAGGAGRGLLYRIDDDGNALVSFDGELPELAALAAGAGDDLLAAFLAPPELEEKRPALEIRLPDGTRVGASDENVGALEPRRGPVLRGTIEDLPGAAEPGKPRLRGQLVRVGSGGEVAELWRSADEAPFCVLRDERGRVLFGTGEPARLYRVEPDGDVALLGSLDEAQVTGLLRIGRALFLSTSNPAAAYRIEERRSESGVFDSHPLDAGAVARWGAVRWRVEGGTGRVEVYTRTGNSPDPDATWSAWSPALTDPETGRVVNPDGRFFQWRARLIGTQDGGPRLSAIRVTYEPYNRPPRFGAFHPVGGRETFSAEAVFAWTVEDPDGDPLEIRLERRGPSDETWTRAARVDAGGEGQTEVEGRLAWDTGEVEEGRHELRAVVSDRAANAPEEGREAVLALPIPATVDRTPPELRIQLLDGGAYEVELADGLSGIGRLELLRDGETLYSARPLDGICDSREERFRIDPPAGDAEWSVRGADAAGNTVERALSRP